MRKILIGLIRGYQLALSPYLGASCRYNPSCSSYAITALQRFGATKGLFLALRRMSRCHPWHAGGEDPVPEKSVPKKIAHEKQDRLSGH